MQQIWVQFPIFHSQGQQELELAAFQAFSSWGSHSTIALAVWTIELICSTRSQHKSNRGCNMKTQGWGVSRVLEALARMQRTVSLLREYIWSHSKRFLLRATCPCFLTLLFIIWLSMKLSLSQQDSVIASHSFRNFPKYSLLHNNEPSQIHMTAVNSFDSCSDVNIDFFIKSSKDCFVVGGLLIRGGFSFRKRREARCSRLKLPLFYLALCTRDMYLSVKLWQLIPSILLARMYNENRPEKYKASRLWITRKSQTAVRWELLDCCQFIFRKITEFTAIESKGLISTG